MLKHLKEEGLNQDELFKKDNPATQDFYLRIKDIENKVLEFWTMVGKLEEQFLAAQAASQQNEWQTKEITNLTTKNDNLNDRISQLETARDSIIKEDKKERAELNKKIREEEKEKNQLKD